MAWNKKTIYVWKSPRVASSWKVSTALSKWNHINFPGMPNFVLTTDRSKADVEVTTVALLGNGQVGGWASVSGGKGVVVLSWKTGVRHRAKLSTHEFGHILGLAHARSGSSVMYHFTGDMASSPTSADIRKLKRLY